MPFLFLMLPMFADPVPGPIRAFGDWVVACDNLHRCEMTSLFPEEGDNLPEDGAGYQEFAFSIEREAGPGGQLVFDVSPYGEHEGKVSLRVDGKTVATGTINGPSLRFVGPPATSIVAAMVQGRELTVNDTAGGVIGRVSLAGSSAALRFIDADQGRAGTVTAAVAKGSKPASAVPAAMAGPVVRFVRPSGTPAKISPALRRAMDNATGCAENYADGEGEIPAIEGIALGGGKTLALLPCGNGAYNFSSVPFIIDGGKPVLAKFDYAPGYTAAEDGQPTLVNAMWDEKTATLTSYSKGRGLGDCGNSEDYVWDGTRFRLTEARSMIECRGSINWLTLWRAGALAQ